jgi:hypothetical protein
LIGTFALCSALGQLQTRPEFEVATVKPGKPERELAVFMITMAAETGLLPQSSASGALTSALASMAVL